MIIPKVDLSVVNNDDINKITINIIMLTVLIMKYLNIFF